MLKRLSVLLTVALAILVARHVDAGVINVTCSNSLADAQSLNALISSSKTGDQISIHGTCLVNSTVVLRGDRTYVGDSRTGTIIKQADGANLTAMLATDLWISDSPYTGSPIHISHLTLDGNKARNIGTSVLVLRSWMSVIDDIYIANAPADAIQITNLSRSGVALTNNQVNGRISNCMITDSGAAGVHVVDSGNSVTDWDLLDCWIAFSGTTAIAMDNAAGWSARQSCIRCPAEWHFGEQVCGDGYRGQLR